MEHTCTGSQAELATKADVGKFLKQFNSRLKAHDILENGHDISECSNANSITVGHTQKMGRVIVIKDMAFRTYSLSPVITSHLLFSHFFCRWRALLFYLYTGDVTFSSLKSEKLQSNVQTPHEGPPTCSPKSMYRLADKVNLIRLPPTMQI